MSNPVLIKSFPIAAALAGNLIVALSGSPDPAGSIDQNEVVITAPERMFTRSRLGRI